MTFFEWKQAFYGSHPMSGEVGIIELFHGKTEEDPQTCFVLALVPS